MRLTKFSDYALRILLLAASRPDEKITIKESARMFGISAAHLKPIVRLLAANDILRAERGRTGGFTLAKPPAQINIRDVLCLTEPDFGLLECFLPQNACTITRCCKIPKVINEALIAFIEVLEKYTLADVQIEPWPFEELEVGAKPLPQPQRGPKACLGVPRRKEKQVT